MKRKIPTKILAFALIFLLGAATPMAIATAVNVAVSNQSVSIDGETKAISAYNIDGSNYFKLRDLAAELDFGVDYDAATRTIDVSSDGYYKPDATTLIQGNWAPETRARMQAVIDANANSGKYVVFDFDNTSVIFDVQEALLVYQIENLIFKIAPTDMKGVLETQIPNLDDPVGKTVDDKDVTCAALIEDIVSDYEWLYKNYSGLGGGGSYDLDYIHATNQYQDFSAKLRYMYSAVGDTFDASVSYPWVTYLFTGMTPKEVQEMATASHQYWAAYGRYAEEFWTSPIELPGKAGVVRIGFVTGVTFTDELRDLYHTLTANGIDVYICSASPQDTIVAANNAMGYGVPEERIFAMRNKLDAEGRYINEYDYDWGGEGMYAQTQAEGKSTVIRNFIAPNYNDAGPLMVFSDSKGDYWMMTDWMDEGDTELGVIFNRYRKTSDPIWECSVEASQTIGDPDARFVLQGRDENTGELIPTQYSRMLGSSDLVLVRPAS